MSILIDKSTRLLVQGITGRDGHFHAVKMKEYGTNVVGGTSPGKGGSTVDGLPVFNTMYEAVEKTQANASILFVPAPIMVNRIPNERGLYRIQPTNTTTNNTPVMARFKKLLFTVIPFFSSLFFCGSFYRNFGTFC